MNEASEQKAKKKVKLKTSGSHANGSVPTVNNDLATAPPRTKIQLDALRTKIQVNVGQIILLMMNLPRYRNQTLADLSHLVLEPLLCDRISIATARPKESNEDNTDETLAGIAIWASVSDAVDEKIREQIHGGAFPIRLVKDDWTSGETLWLLDIVASDRKLATAVFANFSQVAGNRPVSIHPIVSRSVEPALLEKLRINQGAGQ